MVKVVGAQAWQLSLPILDQPVDDGESEIEVEEAVLTG
jgi:hypothetical protein